MERPGSADPNGEKVAEAPGTARANIQVVRRELSARRPTAVPLPTRPGRPARHQKEPSSSVRSGWSKPSPAPVPRRWVVERTFAWLGRFRRLSKDYEYLTATSEAVIYLAMTRLLLRRLTRP